MGSCSGIIKPDSNCNLASNHCAYASKIALHINKSKLRSTEAPEPEIILTRPLFTDSELMSLNSHDMWISSCILPGQDPQGVYFKKCLDKCMHLCDPNSILLALFDGHGDDGEKVVDFCCSYTSSFYADRKMLLEVIPIQSNPSEFLTHLTEQCDLFLNSDSSINTSFSGT